MNQLMWISDRSRHKKTELAAGAAFVVVFRRIMHGSPDILLSSCIGNGHILPQKDPTHLVIYIRFMVAAIRLPPRSQISLLMILTNKMMTIRA